MKDNGLPCATVPDLICVLSSDALAPIGVEQLRHGQQVTVLAAPSPRETEPYPAEKARGGEIILTTPGRRWVFGAGLAGVVLLVLILAMLR